MLKEQVNHFPTVPQRGKELIYYYFDNYLFFIPITIYNKMKLTGKTGKVKSMIINSEDSGSRQIHGFLKQLSQLKMN
jgi:hypothetical protein